MVGLDRQQVRIESHRKAWHECYRVETDRLSRGIADDTIRFEHVGSTAVEGLPAKPVIDILATVDSIDTADSLVEPLGEMGYELRPDDRDRLFFARGAAESRTQYLHVAEAESAYATQMVVFRDHLRENPDVAAAYAELKRSLAEQFPEDRDSYTEGKSAFVTRVLDELPDSSPARRG